MDSSATPLVAAELDQMTLRQWWESRKVARSTAFRLKKLAGFKSGTTQVPGSRAPVAALSQEQIARMDHLAAKLRNGATMAELAAKLETSVAVATEAAQTVSDDSPRTAHRFDTAALLARLEAGERAIATGLPLSTAEVAWLLQARPGGDVVSRAGITAIRHGRNCWQLRRSETA